MRRAGMSQKISNSSFLALMALEVTGVVFNYYLYLLDSVFSVVCMFYSFTSFLKPLFNHL